MAASPLPGVAIQRCSAKYGQPCSKFCWQQRCRTARKSSQGRVRPVKSTADNGSRHERTPANMAALRIILIGGGFAGVKCARTLRARLRPDQAEILLFNQENHMVFH